MKMKKNGELYFVSQTLSSSDFETIHAGDSASAVYATDAAVSFDADYALADESHYQFTAYRMLTDGIMVMKFEAPIPPEAQGRPALSDYTVSEKTFYPYQSESVPQEIAVMNGAPGMLR